MSSPLLPFQSYASRLASGLGHLIRGALVCGLLALAASPALAQWTKIAAGNFHTIHLKSDGTAWTTGDNSYGALGLGNLTSTTTSARVSSLSGINAIVAGSHHTVFLKSDGTVWAAGLNNFGQLGLGDTANRTTPIQVPNLSGITAISAGFYHTLFLKNDGTVWATGANTHGQLGLGDTTNRTTPVQVNGVSRITAIASGLLHTLFLKNDGTVWVTGGNINGQLGLGNTTDLVSPVQVSSLSGITAIAAGLYHTLFLKNDGTVWATGNNANGQLGLGNTVQRTTPVTVGGINGVKAITAGYDYTLFLKNDGTVLAAGNNLYGQLGLGDTASRPTPIQVPNLSGITAITAGGYHTLFLKNDGSILASGNNQFGQLGIGNTTQQLTPVAMRLPPGILSPPNIITVSAGNNLNMTVVAEGSGPLTYQWYVGISGTTTSPISGATNASYTTPALNATTNYWVRVTNAIGTADSSTFTISVRPAITSQSATIINIAAGGTTPLSVTAAGTGLSYQWYQGVTGNTSYPISGATSATYTTPSANGMGSNAYWVRVSNAAGTADSNTFTVSAPPAIIIQPSPQTTVVGGYAFLSVGVNAGTGHGLSYQWYEGAAGVTTTPVSGATSDTLAIPVLLASKNYWVRVSNLVGAVNSASVKVTVLPSVVAPPVVYLGSGATANLTITTQGTGLSYQWFRGTSGITSSPITGATSASYTTPILTTTTSYWVRVTNAEGSINSTTLTATIIPPPSITQNPTSLTVDPRATPTFSVTANGTALSYQWYQGISGTTTTPLSGATTASYTTPALSATASYWVRVTNPAGSVNSTTATTTVRQVQVITFATITPKTFGDAPFTLMATTNSNLPLTYSVVSGSATLSGAQLTLTGGGSVTVRASQAGDAAFMASSKDLTFTVAPAAQIISFPTIGNRSMSSPTVALNATTSSPLAITYTVLGGPANLSGSTLTLTGEGTVSVRASQAGNSSYAAALSVEQSFTVSRVAQNITFPAIGNRIMTSPTVTLAATTSSPLPITYTKVSGPATLSGSTLTLTGEGTVIIQAAQSGSNVYAPATTVEQSFTVSRASQNITFPAIGNRVMTSPSVTLAATTSSPLPITYIKVSGPATLSGSTLTLTGEGTVVVQATQGGSNVYSPATPVEQSFTVSRVAQSITFAAPATQLFRSPLFIPLTASTPSGLPISYTVVSGPATMSGSTLSVTGAGSITIKASQAGNNAYLPAPDTTVTFTVTANAATPTNLTLSKDYFYDNSPTNTLVGYLSVSDTDAGDGLTYALVSGTGSTDNSRFKIVGAELRTNSTALNFDSQRTQLIRVRATDSAGQFVEKAFVLNVVDGTPYAIFVPKGPAFTTSPCYVNAIFQLRDAGGRGINLPKDLVETDDGLFSIMDGTLNARTNPESFAQIGKLEAAPATIKTVLMIDRSQSIGLANLEKARAAANALVDQIFDKQEIAIYAFSSGPDAKKLNSNNQLIHDPSGLELKQNFTRDKAALKTAIATITTLMGSTTDLHGSLYHVLDRSGTPLSDGSGTNRLNLTAWKETFSETDITTGFIVVLTDGDDVAGRKTLAQVQSLQATEDKTVHVVGLLKSTDAPEIKSALRQNWDSLANGLSLDVENVDNLADVFVEVQRDIQNTANSYYWVNYASPRRQPSSFTVSLRNNQNPAANRMLNLSYDGSDFTDLVAGVYINRGLSGQGTSRVQLAPGASAILTGTSLFGSEPSYTWSVANPALVSLTLIPGSNGAEVAVVASATNGTARLTLRDTVNSYTRTIDLVIGTGVSPPVTSPANLGTSLSHRVGSSVSLSLVPSGSSAGLTYHSTGLPSGLSLNTTTGALTGTLTATPGAYTVTYWTQLGTTKSSVRTLTWTVTPLPPTITTQPVGATIVLGKPVSFKVVATGTPTYQWRLDGKNISGATKSTYSLSKTTSSHDGSYTVVVKNSAGSVTSSTAKLVFGTAPKITKQPVAVTATAGASATFSVTATGSPTVSYQWRLGSTNISGATSSSYKISKTATSHAGTYSVVIKNVLGTVTSSSVKLTVNTKPVISKQPASLTVVVGKPATFSVTATGTPAPTYQWRFKGKDIKGATKSSYSISKTASANAGDYSVVVKNSVGSVTSSTVKLAFGTLPKITKQPVARTALEGASATFSVTATGSPAVTYQWRRNGSNISGATKSTYTVTGASAAKAGDYTVVVKNAVGSVTSSVAKLTVTPGPAPQSLVVGALITYTGSGTDSLEGPFTETKSVTTGASNTIDGGTYTYTRTGPNTATITYEILTEEATYSETESSTVMVTFTSATGGTYTSSGDYQGTDSEGDYEGTFSGSGTFSYDPTP